MTKRSLKTLLKTDFNKPSLESWLIKNVCQRVGCNAFDALDDISTHGCESGCVSELIYTTDCLRFYRRFETHIWERVHEFLENTGQTLGQFLDSFSSKIEDETSFKIKLTWFAVEETAHQLVCRFLPY